MSSMYERAMNLAELPTDWLQAIEWVCASPGLTLVLGSPDTGKTTFCALLGAAGAEQGRRVAIVDADVGQSEIGPPTCVGLGFAEAGTRSLSDLHVSGLAFVGNVSPRYASLELLSATVRMVAEARRKGADMVVCDTTGYVRGVSAQRLKRSKAEALQPEQVVVIGPTADDAEAQWLARSLGRTRTRVLAAPPFVRPKPAALRAQRRAWRFAAYFENAPRRRWPMEKLALLGTWLGRADPVQPAGMAAIGRALGGLALYAEAHAGHLGVVVRGSGNGLEKAGMLKETFGVSEITCTPLSRYSGVVAGLYDDDGATIGLGIVEAIDFRSREITLLTPSRSYATTRQIRLGLVRLKPTGDPIDDLRPGDI